MATSTSFISNLRVSVRRKLSSIRQFIDRRPSRLFIVGTILFMTSFVVLFVINALANALLFDGYAADGAFQLLNPLRRLAAGEVIGFDFNFFHGIGVPLLHLPFYYLFGANGLFASEMARWLVSPGLFLATTFIFFYVFRRRWIYAFAMTAFVAAVALMVVPYLVLPLTSLLGVRSTIPVLLLTLMMHQSALKRPLVKKLKAIRSLTLYECLVALLLAVSFICGTEFGIAAMLGFCIAHTFYRADATTLRERALSTARVTAAFLVILLGIFTIVTAGHPLQPLKFALVEIPGDQFWYFGVPPNSYLHLGNVVSVITGDGWLILMAIIALIAATLVFVAHRHRIDRIKSQAFLFGLLAGVFGMVSMLGYYHSSEAASLVRMALLVGSAAATLLWANWQKPFRLGFEFGRLKKHVLISSQGALIGLAVVFTLGAVLFGGVSLYLLKEQYDVGEVVAKARNYLTGKDTNILGSGWATIDNAFMPIIQADNSVAIADVNEGEFKHGISTTQAQVIVSPGDKASFLHTGQIVYFAKSDRQIIGRVDKRGSDQLVLTLQRLDLRLDPNVDGASNKLVVAEDFNHDNRKLWSTYTGLLESEMKTFNATNQGYDYIIHALGEERRAQYIQDFNRVQPRFVITFNRQYFYHEEWLENIHWDFYSLVDRNYDAVAQTDTYTLWKKRAQAWVDNPLQAQQWQPLAVDNNNRKITLQYKPFDQVPDTEAYGQTQIEAERKRLQALDKPVPADPSIDEVAHNQLLVERDREERAFLTRERENAGYETDALEHQAWEQEQAIVQAIKNSKNKQSTGSQLHEPRPKRQVVLVKLKYEASHPLQGLPLFGKTPRYFAEPNNVYWHTPVSLKPYAHEAVFPVIISEWNKDPYIRLNAYSLLPGQGNIKIISAEWSPLETPVGNLKVLTD